MLQAKKVVKRHNHHRPGALFVPVAVIALLLAPRSVGASDHQEETRRIKESIDVLESLVATPDDAIPEYILDRAEAIVVIPTLVKGGLVIGAEHGKGVMSVRNHETGRWSPPSFVTMTGGSFGWQIGLQSVDLVLVVMNREGVDDLLKTEFTLGGNASVAAGPVGRSTEALTDVSMGAKILAYSRAKGLFAGATIEGASLRTDEEANRRFYGRTISAEKLAAADGSISVPAAGDKWRSVLRRIVGPASAA